MSEIHQFLQHIPVICGITYYIQEDRSTELTSVTTEVLFSEKAHSYQRMLWLSSMLVNQKPYKMLTVLAKACTLLSW